MLISAIIPTLDEEKMLPALLDRLAMQAGDGLEVVVSDGGSADATLAIARDRKALVIRAERGRGRQLNAGAAAARGEVLWFVHADCLPDPGAVPAIARAMADLDRPGGYFRLRFAPASPSLRLIAWGSHLRAALTGHVFGDQGLFVRRSAFQDLGGFPDQPLMEDWELSIALGRLGRLVSLPLPMVTSSRRFLAGGTWPTFWRMQALKLRYCLGAPADALAKAYR